jgi:hypothetical protein
MYQYARSPRRYKKRLETDTAFLPGPDILSFEVPPFWSVTPLLRTLFLLQKRKERPDHVLAQGRGAFFDLERIEGFIWMRSSKCQDCGHAIDPLREANRRLRKAIACMEKNRGGTNIWHKIASKYYGVFAHRKPVP